MFIQEVAKQSGLSVRTLRYYDEIGLLTPDEITEAGYRVYHEPSLRRLQTILYYRELDFPLEEIKRLLDHPNHQTDDALRNQLELMKLKQARLGRIIARLEKQVKGDMTVSFTEFNMDEIKAHEEKYKAEVEEKYGQSDAYKESKRRTSKYGKEEWSKIQSESNAIYEALANLKDGDPTSKEAQALVEDWQNHISTYFYPCSKEILQGLGQMYQADERFRENIDKYGEGLTDFLSAAIDHYCQTE